VDFAGPGADLPAMAELSKIYGFSLIEDAAHALGLFYQADGKRYTCGSCAHTDLAVFFSFGKDHSHKGGWGGHDQ
jgi:dTDP-4-amino-4,6-dideoxygalactose transaminase